MVIVGDIDGDLLEGYILRVLQDALHDDRTLGGVFLHLLVFLRLEFSGLVQDYVRDGNFSEVVKRRSLYDALSHLRSQFRTDVPALQMLYKNLDHIAGSGDVTAGVAVPVFYDAGHADDDVILHPADLGGLGVDVPLQILVVLFHQFCVSLLFGVIPQIHTVNGMMLFLCDNGMLCFDDIPIALKIHNLPVILTPHPFPQLLEKIRGFRFDGSVQLQFVDLREP